MISEPAPDGAITPVHVDDAQPAGVLFVNDTGELPLDTRRVLVQLLSGPSLEGRRHPRLWPVLLRDEQVIRRRLAELFLELVLDRDSQVAFTSQVAADELDIPILLRRAQLTFIDSVLLLFLPNNQIPKHQSR